MPSKSKKQQRFMGMIHAFQKGELKNFSPSIKKAAKSIDPNDVKHFASTKHKGLPEKVKKKKKKMNENIITFTDFVLNEGHTEKIHNPKCVCKDCGYSKCG